MRHKARALALVLASAVAVGTAATTLAAPVPMNGLAAKAVTTSSDVTKNPMESLAWRLAWAETLHRWPHLRPSDCSTVLRLPLRLRLRGFRTGLIRTDPQVFAVRGSGGVRFPAAYPDTGQGKQLRPTQSGFDAMWKE